MAPAVRSRRVLWFGALAAVLAGCGSPPPGGPPAAAPAEVTVARPLIVQTLDWDPYTGRLAPIEAVDIRARVSGYLQSHHFDEGQRVERGQLLFVIDPRPFEAELAEARALREEAVAKREQAAAEIAAAEARKQQVLARIDLAEAQLRRARPLVASGAVSQDEFDEYVSAAAQAKADGYAADAGIESAKAAAAAAAAAIVTAEAAQSTAELNLGYCRVEAPIAGRISRRMVTEGNLVSGGLGASILTTIVSTDPIHAYIDASEQELLKYIRLDSQKKRESSRDVKTPVYMALGDERGFPHRGYIDFVENRVDAASGSIRARAIFPNTDETLVSGLFVKVMVPGSGAEERVLIPDAALSSDQGTSLVYVVGEGNKVAAKRVRLGRMAKGLRVVESGLTGEELVVIAGLQRCRPGAEVKPREEALTPSEGDGLPDSYEPVPPEEWLAPAADQTGGTAAE